MTTTTGKPTATTPGHRPIHSAELSRLLHDPDVAIVDVRPSAAYNGWRMNRERRGGHVPGAVSFPHAWIDRLDEAEAGRLLEAKGVLDHRTVVVYGDDAWDAWTFALKVESRGHVVRVFEAGWAAWAEDERLPVDRLVNYHRLIHPEWLAELIHGGRPEAYDGTRYLLFHVNFGVPEEYADGHLPGALYLDTNRLEDSAHWNRRPADVLDATLRELGITHDTTVILYGRDTQGGANEKWPGRRAGQIAATRAAAILHYAGVDDIRVLDGGFDAWVTRGHPLETDDRQPTLAASFGVTIPLRPETIVDIGEAKSILADPDGAALVSVRAWREHIGAVSGYNYIGPAGRISGDVWGNCGSDAYHMQHYRSIDNTMRAYPEIAANWEAAGITPDKWVAFYCGTGWRASETWFYAHLMGWDRIAVYDGGWLEWSADPENNPIEVGVPGEPDAEFAA
jgi:thiosulfate/3-mercaptopyruvate sulfurtransferase